MHHQYKAASFHFTPHQLHKVRKGHKIRLGHHQVGKGPHTLFLHPVQHHKVSLAHAKGKGVDLIVSDGELGHTIDSGVEGTGIWSDIGDAALKGLKWLGGQALDGIAQGTKGLLGDSTLGNKAVDFVRKGVKDATGVGLVKPKKAHRRVVHKKVVEYETESESEHPKHKVQHKKVHHKSKRGNGLYL